MSDTAFFALIIIGILVVINSKLNRIAATLEPPQAATAWPLWTWHLAWILPVAVIVVSVVGILRLYL